MTIKNYIIIILKIIFVCLGSWECEFDIKLLNSLDFLWASLVNYFDCFLDCNKVVFYDMSLLIPLTQIRTDYSFKTPCLNKIFQSLYTPDCTERTLTALLKYLNLKLNKYYS